MNVHPSLPGSVANVAFETGVLAERQRWLDALAEVMVTDDCHCGDCNFRNQTPFAYIDDIKTVAMAADARKSK